MIPGTEGMSTAELLADVNKGGRFVVYPYVVSILIMTFQRTSDVRYIPSDGSAFGGAIPWILVTALFGWWGFPWGFIFTPMALIELVSGGKDVTEDVMRQLR